MKDLITYINETLKQSQSDYINETLVYSGKHTEFVDAILEFENEILILRRANYMKNFKGCWCLPGGAVNKNDEDIKTSIIREIKEETGIELTYVESERMKELFEYKYENKNITHVFYVRLETKPEVKLSKEHSKFEWINFETEIPGNHKWVPELFNILQQWELKNTNENT